MFSRIMDILSLPIMVLNIVGDIIAGIWLAISGEWRLIGVGIVVLITSPWILSILMLPRLPLAALAMHFYGKRSFLAHVFGFLSQLYTNTLMIATCIFAFSVCSSFYSGNIGVDYVPYLLWSWGMALGPWHLFASKEPDNEFSAITLFSASVFYLLFLISIFVSRLVAAGIILIFGVVQLIVLPIFSMYAANQMEKEESGLVI